MRMLLVVAEVDDVGAAVVVVVVELTTAGAAGAGAEDRRPAVDGDEAIDEVAARAAKGSAEVPNVDIGGDGDVVLTPAPWDWCCCGAPCKSKVDTSSKSSNIMAAFVCLFVAFWLISHLVVMPHKHESQLC